MSSHRTALPIQVLLMDLEYTCWEDSIATRWADPARPAEILAIGLAAFDADQNRVLGTFYSLVRPRMNPQLSGYCLDLLAISQDDLDRSALLPAVIMRASDWVAGYAGPDAPTCSWGLDRRFLNADLQRHGEADPFSGRLEINLVERFGRRFGRPEGSHVDRDEARTQLRLPCGTRRHDALSDALDLAGFYLWLRNAPPVPADSHGDQP